MGSEDFVGRNPGSTRISDDILPPLWLGSVDRQPGQNSKAGIMSGLAVTQPECMFASRITIWTRSPGRTRIQ